VRERYVPALAEADYEQVGAYHSPPMNQAWAAAWSRNNPDSPPNRFYAYGVVGRLACLAAAVEIERTAPDHGWCLRCRRGAPRRLLCCCPSLRTALPLLHPPRPA
jgi:hypothetical protein